MAIRRSKEKSLQFDGSIENAKEKCLNALNNGGFKKIENHESLNQIIGKFNNFFVFRVHTFAWVHTRIFATISHRSY